MSINFISTTAENKADEFSLWKSIFYELIMDVYLAPWFIKKVWFFAGDAAEVEGIGAQVGLSSTAGAVSYTETIY